MKERKLKDIVSKYKYSIVLAVLLLCVFVFFLRNHINILFSIVNIIFVFSVLLLTAKVSNKLLRALLTLAISLILSVSISFAVLFFTPLSLGNLASMLETNIAEVNAIPTYMYFVFGICLLTTTILCLKAVCELKWRISVSKLLLLLVALLLFINIPAIAIPYIQNPKFIEEYKRNIKELPLQTIYTYSSIRSPFLYGNVLGLIVYIYEKHDFRKYKNTEKKIPAGLTYIGSEKSIPTIYLVVGESAYRERMSLYGYNVSTTPFLDSIAKVDSTSIHSYNAISIANITRDAVRFSLSFASPFNRNAFWEEKNIVELANNASYNTIWLSNQGQAGLYDNYPSYIARSADQTYFETKLEKEDLYLLSLLDNYHEKDRKQFIIMHLMGSHFPYTERIDENDNSHFEYSNSISDYDKSIYHTDRFLKALYDYTIKKDESSIIVYYSDHGASPERGVHGLQNANISEYEIPLVVLKNNVSINVDSIISHYMDSETRLINNLNLSYILAQLMGYSVNRSVMDQAVSDGQYIMKVNGEIILFDQTKTN